MTATGTPTRNEAAKTQQGTSLQAEAAVAAGEEEDEKVYTLKFVVTGASRTGKTRLLRRMIVAGDDGGDVYRPTVGMEFATRAMRCGNRSIVRAQVRS